MAPFVPPSLPSPDPGKRRPRLPPKQQDRITPNPLRPNILAADCFTGWLTPFGISKLDEASHLFPAHTIIRRRLVMANSVLPSTLSNYAASLIRFTKFCDDFHVPEEIRMPAPETLLSTFISTRVAGSVGLSTMKTWIEGLRLWHIINDAPWHGSLALNHTIKGAAKMAPLSSRRPKRDPVTIEHIRALHCRLDLTNAFNIAVFTVACIAFWGCCRLGKLLIDSSFDPKSHVARDTVISHGVASNGSAFINFDIPRSKTKPNGDRINLSNSTCQCSPTLAFEHHISSNTNLPSDAPLFSFET